MIEKPGDPGYEADYSVDYFDATHPEQLMTEINRLIEEGELTDVTIKVGDEQIRSSQLLLSASSEYFKAMFVNDFGERRDRVVVIEGVSAVTMRQLVVFCSTSHIVITRDNVYDIFNAANRFGFYSIEKTCCDVLVKTMSVSNHLELWCYGEERGVIRLVSLCDQFIKRNILKILPSQVWLEYPLSLVQAVLGSEDLNIYNESQIYDGLVNWIKHDPHKRGRHLPELFACVRLEHISLKYLYHVIAEERMLQESEQCRDMIALVKDRMTLPASLSSQYDPKPRRETGYGAGIFIMGGLGDAREASDKFERFSLNDMDWQNVTNFNESVWGSSATIVEGYLLVSGGEGAETRHNLSICNPAMLEVDDTREVIWDELAKMNVARFGHGMVECMGWAYVVGGYNVEALSSCEMYDLHSDRWSNISPLNFARDGPGVVSLYNAIYAAGGYNGKDYKVVERFDPRVGIWERVPNMEQSRSYGATAVANGKIFCFGGRQKDKKICYVECYDPRASKWESLDDLAMEKSDARAVTIANTIYILGGLDKDDKPLGDVESYHPLSREWMQLPKLTSKRRLMAVASVG